MEKLKLLVPCEQCIVLASCKVRENDRSTKWEYGNGVEPSICSLADREKCYLLVNFIDQADQEDMNRARILFNMEPLI